MSSERSGSARNPGRRSNTPSSLGAGGPRHAACACRRGPHPGPLAFALCFPVLGGFGAPPLSGGFGRRLHCGRSAPRRSAPLRMAPLRRLRPSASLRGVHGLAIRRGPRPLSGGFGRRLHCGFKQSSAPRTEQGTLRRLRPSASLRDTPGRILEQPADRSPAASAVGFIAGRCGGPRRLRSGSASLRRLRPSASLRDAVPRLGDAVMHRPLRRLRPSASLRVHVWLVCGGAFCALRRLRPSASLRALAPDLSGTVHLHSPAASAVGFIAGPEPKRDRWGRYPLRRLRPSASLRGLCHPQPGVRFRQALRRLRPSASLRGHTDPPMMIVAPCLSGGFGRRLHCGLLGLVWVAVLWRTLRRLRPSASLRARSPDRRPRRSRGLLSGGFGRRLHCGFPGAENGWWPHPLRRLRPSASLRGRRLPVAAQPVSPLASPAASAVGFIAGRAPLHPHGDRLPSPAASAVGFIAGCTCARSTRGPRTLRRLRPSASLRARRPLCVRGRRFVDSPAASAVGFIAGVRWLRSMRCPRPSPLRRLRPSASLRDRVPPAADRMQARSPAASAVGFIAGTQRRRKSTPSTDSPAASAVGFIAGPEPKRDRWGRYPLRRLRPSASLRAQVGVAQVGVVQVLSGGFGLRLHCGGKTTLLGVWGPLCSSPAASAVGFIAGTASTRSSGPTRRTLRRLRPSASLRGDPPREAGVRLPRSLSGGFGRRLHCGVCHASAPVPRVTPSPAASAVGFIAGARPPRSALTLP